VPVREVIGRARDGERARGHPLGDGRGTRPELGQRLADVAFLELVDAAQAVAAAHQDRRRYPLHHVADETGRYSAFLDRCYRRLDGTAAVVAEDDDEWYVEDRHRVLD